MDAGQPGTPRSYEKWTICANFTGNWSRQRTLVMNPLSLWLVAQAGGEVLGYVGSQSVMGEADMMNLAVLPAARRRGIARALVTALIRELAGGGVHSLTLEVRASNGPAKALYGSLGFVRVGCRRGYYLSPKEDGEILRKEWDL